MKNIQADARRLKKLLHELARVGPVMRGSVVRLGPYKNIMFSLNKNQKTRIIYLGPQREQAAKTCSANYRKLLEIVDEMTILNMELLKQHVDPIRLAGGQGRKRKVLKKIRKKARPVEL